MVNKCIVAIKRKICRKTHNNEKFMSRCHHRTYINLYKNTCSTLFIIICISFYVYYVYKKENKTETEIFCENYLRI